MVEKRPRRGSVSVDPRPARRQRRFEQILAAAWEVAGDEGVAAVSLHEVARRVGIRQPSLYAYIDSKLALYDAMFGQAARALLDRVTQHDLSAEPRTALREGTRVIAEYAVQNPTAGQLLFNRTIPGFEPSPASYAPAVELLSRWVELLHAAGVTDPGDVDIFFAVVGGLMQQQQSNEPGGNRYIGNLNKVIDMYFEYIDRHHQPTSEPAQHPADPANRDGGTNTSPSAAGKATTGKATS